MEQALINCFGRNEIITYKIIEDSTKALSDIYDELELKKFTKTFET